MIGSHLRKERIVREKRAGTMIGSHSLKERIIKKKYVTVTRPLAAGLPADGIFPEEPFGSVVHFCKFAMAVP